MIKYKELKPHEKNAVLSDFILIALKKLAIAALVGVGIYLLILLVTFLVANPQYIFLVPLIGIPGVAILYIVQSAWEKAMERFENRQDAWEHRCENLDRCKQHEREYYVYQDVLNSGLPKDSKEYKAALDECNFNKHSMEYYQKEVAHWEKKYINNGGKL